jgi:hypothetical protein
VVASEELPAVNFAADCSPIDLDWLVHFCDGPRRPVFEKNLSEHDRVSTLSSRYLLSKWLPGGNSMHTKWNMNMTRPSWLRMAGSGLLVAALSLPAVAQTPSTGGWRMPNLNPFSKSTSGASGSVSDQSKPLVPNALNPFKLIPGTGGSTSQSSYAKPQGPTTWQKVSGGTKRMAKQTADFLNPFDDAAPAPRNESITGSNSSFNQMANPGSRKGTPKKSWFPGWGASTSSETDKPRTVNEFLAQPRVGE